MRKITGYVNPDGSGDGNWSSADPATGCGLMILAGVIGAGIVWTFAVIGFGHWVGWW